jgi:endoglucanase
MSRISSKAIQKMARIAGIVVMFAVPAFAEKPAPRTVMLIDAGNTAAEVTGADGRIWHTDIYFTRGVGDAVDRGDIAIAGTENDRLYQTERWCLDSYDIPLADGHYDVKLHFAETSDTVSGLGDRIFDVIVEGRMLTNIDIFRDAPGKNVAHVKTLTGVEITDARLNITFTKKVNCPMIDAIEILQ